MDNAITIRLHTQAQHDVALALSLDNPAHLTVTGDDWTGHLADYREALALIARTASALEHRDAATELLDAIATTRHEIRNTQPNRSNP